MSHRRLPIYLLVDVSESTAGDVADSIDAGINQVITSLRRIPMALESAMVSVITFSGQAREVVRLTDLVSFKRPKLTLGSGTALGAAIDLWQQVMQRDILVGSPGSGVKSDYKPIAFLLTDGVPTDDVAAAVARLRRSEAPAANLVALACGDQVDLKVLFSLTSNVYHLKSPDAASFAVFFRWVTQSVEQTSKSMRMVGGGQDLILPKVDPAHLVPADRRAAKAIDPDHQRFMLITCQSQRRPYLVRYQKEAITHQGREIVGYKAIQTHRIEAFEPGSRGGAHEMTIFSSLPCPYCSQDYMAICSCGQTFCMSRDIEAQQMAKCPSCGTEGDFSGEATAEMIRGGGG